MKKSALLLVCLLLVVLSACSTVDTKIGQNGPEFEALETSGSMPAKDVYPKLLVPAAQGLTEVERNRSLQAAYLKQAEAIQKGDRKAAEEWQKTINLLLQKPQQPTNPKTRTSSGNAQIAEPVETRSISVSNQTAYQAKITKPKLGIEIAPGERKIISLEVGQNIEYRLTSSRGHIWSKASKRITPDQTDLSLTL